MLCSIVLGQMDVLLFNIFFFRTKIIIVFPSHSPNIITIVLLFHRNFLSIVSCYLLKVSFNDI